MDEAAKAMRSDGGQLPRFLLQGIQQAYWVGQTAALELSTPAAYYVEVDASADAAEGLTAALRRLIQRHEMLRAVILPSGEQHVLDQVEPYEIAVADLRGMPQPQREKFRNTLRSEMNANDLSPELWPQFDIRASRTETATRLHMRFALWMMDGWSFHVLLRELLVLSCNPKATLPPLEMSFAEYAEAQGQIRQSPEWQDAWNYWEPRLAEFPGPPALPLASNRISRQRPRFRHVSRTLPAERWTGIVETCTKFRITPSLLACAAYAEILARYSGSAHFAVTVLYSGRFNHLPRAANVFGNFGTTILLEVDCSRERAFLDRVRALQRQFWRDAEHIEVSGIDVSRALQQRAGSGPGLGVPVTFTAVAPPPRPAGDGRPSWRIDHASARLQVPQVYLDHQMHAGEDGSAIFNWDYVEQIFPAGFVEELANAHLELMSGLAGKEALWTEIDPLPHGRPAPTPAQPPAEPPERLEAAFDRAASMNPDAIAVIDSKGPLTYGQLRCHALAVARQLLGRGVKRGELVGVSLPKGREQVAAVLAVLYAGAAYVPIDPELPEERRHLLLKGSGAEVALTLERLTKSQSWPAGVETIAVDGIDPCEAGELPPRESSTADLAYVIFTSGSTGMPKGVMIDHRGAWNTIADLNARFSVSADDRVLALSSLSFDLSVYDIFGILAAGGTIVMPDAERTKEASHWRDLVREHGVTIWNSVPALMQLALEGSHGSILDSLRLVMLSGDWIPLNLPDQIRPAAPAAEIYSLGGATEASIWSILYPVGRIDPEWRSIPYGHAMKHQSVHVLDTGLAVCPPWVPGDLYIGGVGVALGYWRDEEKTTASFIIHPQTGERLYRTGDMGRYLGDGEIEFLGRKDFQVKIQGYRVECAEIEAAILGGSDIGAAVVTALADAAGTRHLVAYVVPKREEETPDLEQFQEKWEPVFRPELRENKEIERFRDSGKSGTALDALRDILRTTLPAYMVPTYFVVLEKLPLSDNGKVLRKALPAPDFDGQRAAMQSRVPPSDPLEREVAALWSEVLGVTEIGRDDNFFAIGGSSFAGMRLMAKLEQRFGRRLSFAMLVTSPTVAGIAEVLRREPQDHKDPLIVPIRQGEARLPLFCVHPIGGNVMCYKALADALPPGRAIYGIRAPGLAGADEVPLDSIEEMARRYLREIRAIQPTGPYHLLGWSLGGLVVQEMARDLAGSGEMLGLAVMIDSPMTEVVPMRSADEAEHSFSHFVSDLGAVAGLSLPGLPGDKNALGADERLRWVAARLEEGGVPMESSALEKVYKVFEAGSRALRDHVPGNFGGDMILFAATRNTGAAGAQNAWFRKVPNLEMREFDTDHYSIMRAPWVGRVAAEISRRLADFEARQSDRS